MIGAAVDRARLRRPRPVREHPLGDGRVVRLEAAGVQLRGWRAGPTNASMTVVLVPDPPNVIEHHLPQLEAIARDAGVLALELPGFGHSSIPRAFDFGIAAYGELLASVLEAHTEGPLVLAFTCLGGLVGIDLARRIDRTAGLILSQTPSLDDALGWSRRVDPGGLLGTPVVGQLLIRATRRRLARSWYEAALPRGSDAEPWLRPALEAYESGAEYCLASALQALRATPPIPTTPVAATLLWGNADRTHRPSEPERLRSALPELRVRRLDGVGHFPDLEAPAVFAGELRSLFDRVAR